MHITNLDISNKAPDLTVTMYQLSIKMKKNV